MCKESLCRRGLFFRLRRGRVHKVALGGLIFRCGCLLDPLRGGIYRVNNGVLVRKKLAALLPGVHLVRDLLERPLDFLPVLIRRDAAQGGRDGAKGQHPAPFPFLCHGSPSCPIGYRNVLPIRYHVFFICQSCVITFW